MFKRLFNGTQRFLIWHRRIRFFGGPRRQSDYRASSLAEKLVKGGSLQATRLTGSPLVRGQR